MSTVTPKITFAVSRDAKGRRMGAEVLSPGMIIAGHMRLKHGLIDGGCEMDDLTKKIRGERKKKRNRVDHEL
jgi:hypothetical protein